MDNEELLERITSQVQPTGWTDGGKSKAEFIIYTITEEMVRRIEKRKILDSHTNQDGMMVFGLDEAIKVIKEV